MPQGKKVVLDDVTLARLKKAWLDPEVTALEVEQRFKISGHRIAALFPGIPKARRTYALNPWRRLQAR